MIDIERFIKKDFNGAVLVKKGKSFRFEKAYGYADISNQVRNTINTKFPTASAGKVFVAVGILQLIEKKRLSFQDTIGKLLEFDLKGIDVKITVEQLLAHTSGIPDYFDESIMDDYDSLWRDYPNYKIRNSKELLGLFIDKPMMYPPGERFQYNNSGYVILGLIIEGVMNIPFDQYLDQYIFRPSDMLDTGYYELDRLPAKCANAYIFDEKNKEYYSNIYSVDVKGTGAGGAFTTVLDIEKFWRALFSGKILSRPFLDKMLSPQASKKYGYGMWLEKRNNQIYIPYFQGSDPGVSFISTYSEKKDMMITISSNFSNDVWTMKKAIMEEIRKDSET